MTIQYVREMYWTYTIPILELVYNGYSPITTLNMGVYSNLGNSLQKRRKRTCTWPPGCWAITRQVPDTSRVALAYLSVPADPSNKLVCPTPRGNLLSLLNVIFSKGMYSLLLNL